VGGGREGKEEERGKRRGIGGNRKRKGKLEGEWGERRRGEEGR